jgi:hypothetical protein
MLAKTTRCCGTLFFLATLTACAEVVQESPSSQLHISPENPNLVLGGSLQFQATFSNGALAPVSWQVDEPEAATITAGGLFTSKICTPMGSAHVRALLQADPTQTAVTQVTFVEYADALVSLISIAQVPSGTVARIDSLVGTLDVATHFNAGTFPCRAVASARLELIVGSLVLPLDSITFSPTATAPITHSFRWNTANSANGAYFLRVTARKPDGTTVLSSALPIQVRNP